MTRPGAVRQAPAAPRRVAAPAGALAAVTIALVALVALGRAAPAIAAPSRLVTAPSGWAADPEQAAELARRLAKVAHFDGLVAETAAEAYVAGQPGLALFATRATAALPDPARAPRAARAALDELRAMTRRTALAGGAGNERTWQERVDDEARTVSATLAWNDPASHAVDTARIVVVSDGRRIAAVTGECLASEATDRALADACIAQLASLDPGIAPGERVALVPAPPRPAGAPEASPDRAVSSPATMSPAPGDPSQPPPRLDDRSRVVLPPMVIPASRPEADRRPIYLGAGLLALAVVFWWNRRRRDRFEREDQGEDHGEDQGENQGSQRSEGRGAAPAAPSRRARPRRDRDTDADADDLRAAALGDAADAPAEASHETPPGSDKVPRS